MGMVCMVGAATSVNKLVDTGDNAAARNAGEGREGGV